MKKSVIGLLFMLLLVFGFTMSSFAEQPDDIDRPLSKGQVEKVRERIETLRMWKLTKALDLDEKTSSQLFPLLNRYDKNRTDTERAIQAGMKELRESLKRRNEGQLKAILDKLERDHKALQSINDEERVELKNILTIEQQAKFVLFQAEFNREIRKIIADARARRLGRPEKDEFEKPVPQEGK